MTEDSVNAFIEVFTVEGAEAGPLKGLTVGVKDLYDIAGHVTGCGNPDWARTHEPAVSTASAVQSLLDAGATIRGKTHTDELAYSLMGVNAHYGTPINSAAPDRVPGGSSSGSVAATAAGIVDIGLGSDTGGSVRMPASFCGVYGIRTTHGLIALDGTMPLAPSFDSCGWFARDAATLVCAGLAYGINAVSAPKASRLLVAMDAFDLSDRATGEVLRGKIDSIAGHFSSVGEISLADGDYPAWREVFRICQAAEVWQSHGDWVTATDPDFGPGIRERFQIASSIGRDALEPAKAKRSDITGRFIDLLGDDVVVALPTAPGPAPLRSAQESALDSYRMAALELLCPAGLAGLPQVSIPAGLVDGAPVGLSLMAGRGRDAELLAWSAAV